MTTTTTQAVPPQQPLTKATGGAPKGNRNALRHGLRCGELPPGCGNIESYLNEYRRDVEDAVAALRGVVSVVDAGTINRAMMAELKRYLAIRWLRLESESMTPEVKQSYGRDIHKASEDRDRAIADLELDQKPLRSLYALANGRNGNGESA